MTLSESLQTLSVTEKIQIMESLWNDLCQQANQVKSPDWHQQILAKRESAIKLGEDKFIDWEAAKRRISQSL